MKWLGMQAVEEPQHIQDYSRLPKDGAAASREGSKQGSLVFHQLWLLFRTAAWQEQAVVLEYLKSLGC